MSQTIVSTKKMVVTIGDEFVLKEFKPVPGAKKRYYTEKEALHLIRGVHGVPKLVSYSDKDYHLKISRLNGEGCEKFSDSALMQIRHIIEETIKRGVARHSLPLRDILVDKDDNVSIVDFERATLKNGSFSLFWFASTLVTKFHLCRLINNQNPELLSVKERNFVRIGIFFREIFNVYQLIRDFIRNTYRKNKKSSV